MRMLVLGCAAALLFGSVAEAAVSTSFSNADGFATGATGDVMLSDGALTVTFSGGVQQQSFDGPSYNAGPDAYFFINGTFTGSFGGTQAGSTDVGTISFSTGVDEVSFFAADRANGTPSIRVIADDGVTVLTTVSVTGTSNQPGATPFTFTSSVLGDQIGSIEIDNAGPAGNPPYVTAIDSFSASVSAVPEPSSMIAGLVLVGGAATRRLRKRRKTATQA